MARVQPVLLPDATRTFTVTGADHLPVSAAEEYLAYLREHASPNTVRTYAASIAQWLTVLEALGHRWDDFPSLAFGQFITYVRTGDLPGAERIGPAEHVRKPSTVQNRVAGVLAFYTWQAEANGHHQPYERLYSSKRKSKRSKHVSFLDGIASRSTKDAQIFKVRAGRRSRTPVLTPEQARSILDACSTQTPDGSWTGGLCGIRDRLLFATMLETGMRIGQALSLRNLDWNIGSGRSPSIELVPRQDHPHQLRNKTWNSHRVYIGDDLEALYSAYIWHLIDNGIEAFVDDINGHFTFVNIARGEAFAAMRTETVYAKQRAINRHHPSLPDGWTPHWLRHTHATALLLAGVEPHVVMRRLGHAQVQTTLDTYGWVTEDAELRSVAQWKEFAARWRTIND